jgi:hypothetical protein
MPGRRAVEVGVVVAAYILFLIGGVYSGQTTMNVDIISPPDGAGVRSSPVELVARVTVRGVPLTNVTTTFTVYYWTTGRTDTDTKTDNDGVARLLLLATSGNYSWHVAAMKEGYPTIVSRSRSFSVELLLVVEPLLPSTFRLAVSPVNFRARVTDMNGRPVQSANVTFYVDSMMIGSNLTDQKGIAQLSKALTMGRHTWFASAGKEGEGGISDTTLFVVGQLASLGTGSLRLLRSELRHVSRNGLETAMRVKEFWVSQGGTGGCLGRRPSASCEQAERSFILLLADSRP